MKLLPRPILYLISRELNVKSYRNFSQISHKIWVTCRDESFLKMVFFRYHKAHNEILTNFRLYWCLMNGAGKIEHLGNEKYDLTLSKIFMPVDDLIGLSYGLTPNGNIVLWNKKTLDWHVPDPENVLDQYFNMQIEDYNFPLLTNVKDIFIGYNECLILKSDGSLYQITPNQFKFELIATCISGIHGNFNSSCYITDSHDLYVRLTSDSNISSDSNFTKISSNIKLAIAYSRADDWYTIERGIFYCHNGFTIFNIKASDATPLLIHQFENEIVDIRYDFILEKLFVLTIDNKLTVIDHQSIVVDDGEYLKIFEDNHCDGNLCLLTTDLNLKCYKSNSIISSGVVNAFVWKDNIVVMKI